MIKNKRLLEKLLKTCKQSPGLIRMYLARYKAIVGIENAYTKGKMNGKKAYKAKVQVISKWLHAKRGNEGSLEMFKDLASMSEVKNIEENCICNLIDIEMSRYKRKSEIRYRQARKEKDKERKEKAENLIVSHSKANITEEERKQARKKIVHTYQNTFEGYEEITIMNDTTFLSDIPRLRKINKANKEKRESKTA